MSTIMAPETSGVRQDDLHDSVLLFLLECIDGRRDAMDVAEDIGDRRLSAALLLEVLLICKLVEERRAVGKLGHGPSGSKNAPKGVPSS